MAPPIGHIPWNKGLKGWNKNYKNAGFQKKNTKIQIEKKRATQDEIDRSFINIRKDFNTIGRGFIKKYEIPCEVCGKIQIRYVNIKTAFCFKHSRELRKEREKERKMRKIAVP